MSLRKTEIQPVGSRKIAQRRKPSDFGVAQIEDIPEWGLDTLGELIDRFAVHLQTNGSRETWITTKSVLERFHEYSGHIKVDQARPSLMVGWQRKMIELDYARTTINRDVLILKRMFRWGVEERLIPAVVSHGMGCVSQLHKGMYGAREPAKIGAAILADMEATAACVAAPVGDMIHAQWLMGCRPGEICRLAPMEIVRDFRQKGIWAAFPSKHKNLWRGLGREIIIGPRAQEFVGPYMSGAYCFVPPPPSQNKHYCRQTYYQAVVRGARRAGVPLWFPNQLRHSRLTQVEHMYGREGSQAIGGHASAKTTEAYIERDIDLAIKIAKEIG